MITTLLGDSRTTLATVPDKSVQCIVTSPPYWGLRDYGTATWDGGAADCDHLMPAMGGIKKSGLNAKRDENGWLATDGKSQPNRQNYHHICGKCGATRIDQQIGLEPTPSLYIAALMDVFKECWRVLRDDGVMFVNIGDSYGHGTSAVRQHSRTSTKISTGQHEAQGTRHGGMEKQLMGIPWRLAFALQDAGWYLRSDIIWEKPSCMPESVTDRPTRSHEYVFLLSKRPHYFYDALAIAEPAVKTDVRETTFKRSGTKRNGLTVPGHTEVPHREDRADTLPNGTRNRRTIWRINTQPSTDAHYAMMPERLAELCILAGSSPQACEHCGAPWERTTEPGEPIQQHWAPGTQEKIDIAQGRHGKTSVMNTGYTRPNVTTGWESTCRCTNNGTGKSIVLDPFGGSGTTARVAEKHGRDGILCELNAAYLPMIEKRTNNVQTMMEVA